MRAMTSPRRTSAPSCDTTQVSTPSRSDFVVERSSSRRACAASLSSEPRSSERPSSCTPVARSAFFRSSRSCASSICACLTDSSDRRSASRENSPSLNSCWSPSSCACADWSFERLDLEPAVEIDQRFLERQPRLRLLVVLDLEVLHHLLERQHRFADIELDDGVALLQVRARGAEAAGARARPADSRARARPPGRPCPDAMITASTGPAVTIARANARAGHGRPNPPGQPHDHQRSDQDRNGHLQRFSQPILTPDSGREVAIHAPGFIKAHAASGQKMQ